MFRVKCKGCSEYTVTAVLEGGKCSSCGRVLSERQLAAPLPKQPKKEPFSPGWRFVATVTPHPIYGRALVTSRPARFWPFRIAPPSFVALPLQQTISFEVVRRDRNELVVRPIDPPPASRKLRSPAPVPMIDPARLSNVTTLNFPGPGSSELEILAVRDPIKAVERVGYLALHKDDPAAWWALALGHRAVSIRAPIEGAFKQVGMERIERMLRQNVVEWDPDLMDFVDSEMGKIKARRPGSPNVLPGDRQGWDKPWWADD